MKRIMLNVLKRITCSVKNLSKRKIGREIICIIFLLFFTIIESSIVSNAETLTTSGIVNDNNGNVTSWEYNADTKELSLSGVGSMAYCGEKEGWRQYYNVVEKITVEGEMTTVSDSAFDSFQKCREVVLPDSITIIKYRAFSGCEGLRFFEMPKSLVTIENDAFNHAFLDWVNGYTDVAIVFPNTLKSIGDSAFYYCNAIKVYNLPESLTDISNDSFGEHADSTIIYCGTEAQINYCKTFEINYIDKKQKIVLSSENVEVKNCEYSGKEVHPVVYCNNVRLVEGTDYDATYENNVEIGNATIHITGKGIYQGDLNNTFKITKININPNSKSIVVYVLIDGKKYNPYDPLLMAFDGKKHTCVFDSIYCDGTLLVENIDYTKKLEVYDEYGCYFSLEIKGINKYTGGINQPFRMFTQPKLSEFDITMVSDESVTFNEKDQTPEFEVTYNGNQVVYEKTDYGPYDIRWWESDKSWEDRYNFTYPGKGTVFFKISWFDGYELFDYEIKAIDLSTAEVSFNEDDLIYRGWEVMPIPKVMLDGKELSYGTDFTVSYENNTSGGTATATIEGCGGYGGTIQKQFDIKTSISVCQVDVLEKTVNYTGDKCTPSISVKLGDNVLVHGKDYEIQYDKNIDEGMADVIITGIGDYVETKTVNFIISKQDISAAQISLAQTSFTYDGTEKKPQVKIEYEGKTLVENTDYSISYTNYDGVGQAGVPLTGKGIYKGTLKAEYTINPISIDSASVSLKDTIFTYDGSAKKPSAEVKLNDILLTEGKDYTLSYRDNINEGTAYAVVEGIGIYSGTIEVSFKILPYNSGMDAVYKEEDTLIDDNYLYHVIDVDNKEVEFSAPADMKESEVVIPSTITLDNGDTFTVTSIGEKAFYKNTKIKKLTIANTVTSIENYAFYGCKNLTSVKIGNGIEIIGDSAFRKCAKLTSITLPKSVDKLGKNVFYGCKKLKTITIKSNQVVDIQSNAIKGVSKKCVIKVPKKLVNKYKKEFNKKTGFTKTMKIKKQ